jgi:hypothetical protein
MPSHICDLNEKFNLPGSTCSLDVAINPDLKVTICHAGSSCFFTPSRPYSKWPVRHVVLTECVKRSTVLKCSVLVNSFMIIPSFVKIGRLVKTQKCLLTCAGNRVLSKFALFCVTKTNLTHYLTSVYFVSQPLHVSGIFVAHHQEVYCIYTTTGTCWAFQLTVCWPFGHCSPSSGGILYIYKNWYVLGFSVDCLLAGGQQTVNWKAQHVPVVVYIQYNSWWCATNMPETCRNWLTK